jgi:hypothetical protein
MYGKKGAFARICCCEIDDEPAANGPPAAIDPPAIIGPPAAID